MSSSSGRGTLRAFLRIFSCAFFFIASSFLRAISILRRSFFSSLRSSATAFLMAVFTIFSTSFWISFSAFSSAFIAAFISFWVSFSASLRAFSAALVIAFSAAIRAFSAALASAFSTFASSLAWAFASFSEVVSLAIIGSCGQTSLKCLIKNTVGSWDLYAIGRLGQMTTTSANDNHVSIRILQLYYSKLR
ncbi:hypothetical protein ATCV1_z763L [Acanthocystis turfacea chlorella virus 1]|uniref:Uncharacterized protein z763L n=1 Tax=Chlorovirus heliozoae TaxID=322019 RepID=A7KA23_9PHYC|nr:hypothetical protein ATCV1_z763L [Acanthocystis turfacea chlorella virus 1]ABT16897.1 hypothetical protein ATCV1_z763L [Acanthocystis turfacea chlorella virus 1]